MVCAYVCHWIYRSSDMPDTLARARVFAEILRVFTGGISLDGASRSIGGAVLPGPEGGVPSAPPVAAASAAAPAIPAAPTAGTAAGCGTTPEAVTAEGAAGSVEEAGAAPVEAVSVQAAAEGALVAGNDSLDSGASTKPDVDLKPPGGDEMLEE